MKRRDFMKFFAASSALIGVSPLMANNAEKDNFIISDVSDISKKMLEEIYKSNDYYTKSKKHGFFESFTASQHPRVTLVGCSDSRVQVGAIDDTPENDIFVVRNIGNQFASNPGSVEYGVHHLHTPLLIIMGHTRCGAVKAAMSDYSKESMYIKKEIDSLNIAIKKAKDGVSENERWLNAVVANVHMQVCNCIDEFAKEVDNGKLTVVGMVYDIANDLRAGYGKLKIVNVNGEADTAKIQKMPIFRNIAV
jgi:carbonic anhydrase